MKQLIAMGVDYVYDYNFYGLLCNLNSNWENQLKIFGNDIIPYEDFKWGPAERLRDYLRQFSFEELKKLLFFLENQDTPRIRELIPDIEELKALSVIAAAMPGGLLINNGQELGENGKNPSATFIADSGTSNKKIKKFYAKLFPLLNRDLFRKGGFEMLIPTSGRKNVFAAWRSFGSEKALTVVNCSDKARINCEIELPVTLHPDKTYYLVDALNPQIFFELRGASLELTLAPWQTHIFFIEESPRHHEDFPSAEKLIGQAI